ncbi:interleukin-17F-like isoform X1 [Manacus candei]|uniref:interleukin-17F-like isoform X1 n=1 Tax=Manacus candei TaxID=415023 RepID=UPI002225E844|nr:interleukin-17F-like isoform X1 [Manacus candei]
MERVVVAELCYKKEITTVFETQVGGRGLREGELSCLVTLCIHPKQQRGCHGFFQLHCCVQITGFGAASSTHSVEVNIRISKSHHAFRMVHDVRNRSLAPWDYRLDKDPNRFPQVIADAQCRLSGCVSPLGQEDHSLNSVPIKQEILVLRREQQGCRPTYRLEKKVITVGCTCVTPVIHHHS